MLLSLKMKERALLLYSSVVENYPWLREFLQQNEKITSDLVEDLPVEQRTFLGSMLDRIIQAATNEWKGDENRIGEDRGPDRRDWEKCSLCGQPNRYIFYITNIINGRSLNVGSDCIKYFWEDGKIYGSMTFNEIKKHIRRTKRQGELEEKFRGIVQTVENWRKRLDSYPLVMPAFLEKKYNDAGEKLGMLYEGYLNEDYDEGIFDIISNTLKEFDAILKEVEEYVKINAKARFIATRDIAMWLKERGYASILEMIKEDNGLITWRTGYRIEEPGFLESIVPDLNIKLGKSVNVRILAVDSYRGGYVFEHSQNPGIKLLIRHRELLLDFGYLLFEGDPLIPLNMENLLKKSTIYDENSIDNVIKNMVDLLRFSDVRLWGYSYEANELIVYLKNEQRYIVSDLKALAEKFKNFLLDADNSEIEELVSYISGFKGKRYTLAEIIETENIRKMGGGQKYVRLE